MKNSKTIIIILSVLLAVSLCANVYLIVHQSDLNNQLAETQNYLQRQMIKFPVWKANSPAMKIRLHS